MTANVFAVVGQHRDDPSRLLLLGEDGRYYAYAADHRPVQIALSDAWYLDGGPDDGGGASARPAPRPSPPATTAVGGRPAAPRSKGIGTWSRQLLGAAAGLLLALGLLPAASAHAPGLVQGSDELPLLAAPDPAAAVEATLPAGDEIELTGAAAGDFLEVVVGEGTAWVPVDLLDGPLATADVWQDAPLRLVPNAGGELVATVPAGTTVILTGAAVDGYVAASWVGNGGWLPAEALA